MDFYELKNKDLAREFREFHKSTYGRIVFALGYANPGLLLVLTIVLFIVSKTLLMGTYILPFVLLGLVLTYVSFILGTRYFYHEFKEYYTKRGDKKE